MIGVVRLFVLYGWRKLVGAFEEEQILLWALEKELAQVPESERAALRKRLSKDKAWREQALRTPQGKFSYIGLAIFLSWIWLFWHFVAVPIGKDLFR